MEEKGNKCLGFASTDKNKEVLKKYEQLWDEIKKQMKIINCGKPGEYEKEFVKFKCISDQNLSLNKILKLYVLTVINRYKFEKDGKYYPQVFLDECLYEW